jgi:predicted nucleotidyltransferase
MRLQQVQQSRERAERVTQYFASLPAVDGVCLFGSVARGNPNEWSDIDLLVVGSDRKLSPTVLLSKLPQELKTNKMSLFYYTHDELQDMFTAGLSFAKHLRREAQVLYDRTGFLTSLLDSDLKTKTSVQAELEAHLGQLAVYNDLQMFKDNFLFVLARLYTIGKAVVMLALVAEGADEFSRDAAFARFAEQHPELASEVAMIARLRPFYRRVTQRGSEPLPFPYRGAEREVREAISAIRRLGEAVR